VTAILYTERFMVWEIIFMLVILKIPIVYLCVVVWWAIKAEPAPPDLVEVPAVTDTPPVEGPRWQRRRGRPRPMRPHATGRGPAPQRGGVHA
jgi:hypothetical protein